MPLKGSILRICCKWVLARVRAVAPPDLKSDRYVIGRKDGHESITVKEYYQFEGSCLLHCLSRTSVLLSAANTMSIGMRALFQASEDQTTYRI